MAKRRQRRHTKIIVALTAPPGDGKSMLIQEILLPALLAAGCIVKRLPDMDAPGFPPTEVLHVLAPVNSAARLRRDYQSYYAWRQTGAPLPRQVARRLEEKPF